MSNFSPALQRFRDSMSLDYGRWKDGDPYDLGALDEMSEAERAEIERDMCAKRILDWRDVEALQRLGSASAHARIMRAANEQADDGGAAALRLVASEWTDDAEARFIAQLNAARLMETSLDTLFGIAVDHPTSAVRQALFRLATEGNESVRYAFGAFLLFLAGKADDWYGLDETYRPHLLDLTGETRAAREAAASWLATMIAPDAAPA